MDGPRTLTIVTEQPAFDEFISDTRALVAKEFDHEWHSDFWAMLDDLELESYGPQKKDEFGRFGATQNGVIRIYCCNYRPVGYGGSDTRIWYAVYGKKIMLISPYNDGINTISNAEIRVVEARLKSAFARTHWSLFPFTE